MSSALAPSVAGPGGAPSARVGWIIAALVVADMVSTIESSMIFSAYKAIITETGSPITAGWLVSIYFVVSGPAAVICGRLGDIYGRKRVLMVALTIVCVGSVLSAVSTELPMIILGRAMQGASGAIIALCIGLLRNHIAPSKIGFPLGLLLAASSIGVLVGLVAGGLIVDTWHWRHVFTFSAGAAGMALTGILLFVPRSARGPAQRLDWVGALLYAPAVAGLLYGISAFNSPTLSHAQALGIIVASGALLAVWIAYELKQESPLVDLRSFANRSMVLICVTCLLVYIGPVQIPQLFALFLQQPIWTGVGFGLTATAASLFKLPSNLAAAAAAPAAGWATTRWNGRVIVLIGGVLGVIAWSSLAFSHNHFWIFLAVAFFASIASGTQNAGLTTMMVTAAPSAKTSEVLGSLDVVKALGQAIGAQLVALTLSLSVVSDAARGPTAFPSNTAHTMTFTLIAVCAALSIATTLAMRRPSKTATSIPSRLRPPKRLSSNTL